jgi:hypothetical protein
MYHHAQPTPGELLKNMPVLGAHPRKIRVSGSGQALWEHACNSRTQEVKAGRFQVLGQPGVHSETLS